MARVDSGFSQFRFGKIYNLDSRAHLQSCISRGLTTWELYRATKALNRTRVEQTAEEQQREKSHLCHLLLTVVLCLQMERKSLYNNVAERAKKELEELDPSAWPVEPATVAKIYSSVTRTDRPRVFLEVTADGQSLGRIVLELRGDVVPRTAENFRALCAGELAMPIREL